MSEGCTVRRTQKRTVKGPCPVGPKVIEIIILERKFRENMVARELTCPMQPRKQNQGQDVKFSSK